MERLIASKEYREDLGEQGEDGTYDYAYRYWLYAFEIGGRSYTARIYTDTPEHASITSAGGMTPTEDHEDLSAITEYLRAEAGVLTIATLGANGYEPWSEGGS